MLRRSSAEVDGDDLAALKIPEQSLETSKQLVDGIVVMRPYIDYA
jgi:hypothetical protein